MNICALPTQGWQLIQINDDYGSPVETRLSKPEIVLGFIVTERDGHYFAVRPVTPFGVYDECPAYALVRSNGQVYLPNGPECFDDMIFRSVDDLKQHLRWFAKECFRETAEMARKDGDRKNAATFSRVAKEFQREIDENS